MSHTPGPWEAQWELGQPAIYATTGGRAQPRKFTCIADLRPWDAHMTEAERLERDADAQLIAAAPCLAEALQFVLTDHEAVYGECHCGICEKARAALKKAGCGNG